MIFVNFWRDWRCRTGHHVWRKRKFFVFEDRPEWFYHYCAHCPATYLTVKGDR